jgi:hypothetical protein
MKIKRDHLDNGGEVDIKTDIKTNSRVSIRKRGKYYELYRAYYRYLNGKEREEVIFKSEDLNEVVDFSNRMFGMDDEVI